MKRSLMILKGNQRGGAGQMALHLLNAEANEHVDVHEVRGFVSDDVHGALNEVYAMSKATKCKQFMYSLSLSPPEDAIVESQYFEEVLGRVEKRLDLVDQPRVVIFHEKEGRRHAHCVWSRIDVGEMKSINISHPKLKLKTIGKDIFLENGWDLPKGYIDYKYTSPLNFTRAEWEKAQRTGQHPNDIKRSIQEAWSISDNRASFESALEERGYFLAQGNKKRFVVLDTYGQFYALTKSLGAKKADIEKQVGDAEKLRNVEDTKKLISSKLTLQFREYFDELESKKKQKMLPLIKQKRSLVKSQREVRAGQKYVQGTRWQLEERKRNERVRKGFKGLWDKLTGSYKRTKSKNEKETAKAQQRDSREKESLIAKQLSERQKLQTRIQSVKVNHVSLREEIFKGMSKHYKNIERQAEIKQIYEKEFKDNPDARKEMKPDIEPEI